MDTTLDETPAPPWTSLHWQDIYEDDEEAYIAGGVSQRRREEDIRGRASQGGSEGWASVSGRNQASKVAHRRQQQQEQQEHRPYRESDRDADDRLITVGGTGGGGRGRLEAAMAAAAAVATASAGASDFRRREAELYRTERETAREAAFEEAMAISKAIELSLWQEGREEAFGYSQGDPIRSTVPAADDDEDAELAAVLALSAKEAEEEEATRRHLQTEADRIASVLLIQAVTRGMIARRQVAEERKNRKRVREMEMKREAVAAAAAARAAQSARSRAAAITIQAVVRGVQCRRRLRDEREQEAQRERERREREEQEERERQRRLEEEEAAARKRLLDATVRLQAAGRGYLARCLAKSLRDAERAAVRIQAAGRGFLGRRKAHSRLTAAKRIQFSGRVWCVRLKMERERQAQERLAAKDRAASRIQAAARGMIGRRLANAERQRRADCVALIEDALPERGEANSEATQALEALLHPSCPPTFHGSFPQPRFSSSSTASSSSSHAARPPRPPSTEQIPSRAGSPVMAGLDSSLAPLLVPKSSLFGKRMHRTSGGRSIATSRSPSPTSTPAHPNPPSAAHTPILPRIGVSNGIKASSKQPAGNFTAAVSRQKLGNVVPRSVTTSALPGKWSRGRRSPVTPPQTTPPLCTFHTRVSGMFDATRGKSGGKMEHEMSPSRRVAIRAKDRATDVAAREAAVSAKRLAVAWRGDTW